MVEPISAIHIEFFHNQDHVSQGINGIITSNTNKTGWRQILFIHIEILQLDKSELGLFYALMH